MKLKGDFSMPYIAIKSFPKDQETKEAVVEKINEIFLEVWGCPQEAITISIEDVMPEDWEEKIVKPKIEPKREYMMILSGEKYYKEK
jgi:4-oxalocrotonate tautomerase